MRNEALRQDQIRTGRIAIGILGVIIAAGYLVMALQMPFGSPDKPGPGMFPTGVGVAGIVISLVVIGEAVLTRPRERKLDLPRGDRVRLVVGFSLLTIAYIALLPILGLMIAATLYIAAMLRFMGRLPWWKVAVYGVVTGVGISLLFTEVLQVPLPEGIWQ